MFLLDTNIIAAVVNDPRGPTAATWRRHAELTVTSAIVRAEVAYGVARQRSRKALAAVALLDAMECLPFSSGHADAAGHVRADLDQIGRPAGAFDSLIAGVARAENLVLVTRNTKHFEHVPQLALEQW